MKRIETTEFCSQWQREIYNALGLINDELINRIKYPPCEPYMEMPGLVAASAIITRARKELCERFGVNE